MERKAGPVPKMDFQPEFNLATVNQPLTPRQPLQLFPDNLPALIDSPFTEIPDQTRDVEKASRDIEKASKSAQSFLEEFVERSTVKGEIKTLNRINSASFKSTAQTQEQINISKQIKKGIGKNNVECYLKGKRSLKRLHTLSIKTAGLISWLDDLVDRNIESMDQVANLENDSQTPEDKNASIRIVGRHLPVQILKTRAYVGQINLLTQDRVALSLLSSEISIFLQQKLEPAIYAEYYRKAQAISLMYKESPFKGIFSSFLDVPRLDYIILSVKSISGKQDPNEPFPIENKDYLNDCDPTGVLQFHKFDIEDPLQYPDYQIARHYLARINTWVIEHLFNKNGDTWRMIIDDNSKLKTISDLAKNLLKSISPDLQKDWMKEVVEKLDSMTNEKSKWKKLKKTDKPNTKYTLKGNFFIRKSDSSEGVDLISLSGEVIEHDVKIYYPKDKNGNILFEQDDKKISLPNNNGKTHRLYKDIKETEFDVRKICTLYSQDNEPEKMDLLNENNQIIHQNCSSISMVLRNGARVIEKEGVWFISPREGSIILLDQYQNISVTDRYAFITIVGQKKDGSYVLLDDRGEIVSDTNYRYVRMSTELAREISYSLETLEAETDTGQIVYICTDGHIFRWNGIAL